MRRNRRLVLVACVLLGAPSAFADKLSDFKDAVGKVGCESIPYSDLQGTCKSQQSYVHEYCDGSRGPVTCGSESITRQLKDSLDKAKRNVEALKEKKRKLEDERSRASDENEKNRLTKEIEQADKDLYEAGKQVDQAVADLEKRKSSSTTRSTRSKSAKTTAGP